MVVAFDLRPLQSGHQFRGIGIALHNILKELLKNPQFVKNWEIIYYVYGDRPLPSAIEATTVGRIIKIPAVKSRSSRFKLLRRLKFLIQAWSKLQMVNKLPGLDKIDVFVQFDFLLGLPKNKKAKNVLIKYDIIPLVMERHYLPSYSEVKARTNNRKTSILAGLNRRRYLYSLKISLNRSDLILAISKHTKNDLEKYMNIAASKVKVLYLAADDPPQSLTVSSPFFETIDWRFIKSQSRLRNIKITDVPYLLYIGGADPRRRIQDLVTAFNHVRAEGIECRLILVGYDFQYLNKIPNLEVQEAIRNSSFGEDIYLSGFVDTEIKTRLYNNALAFVYPTVYEGFGLPILEAMANNCPVICYKNSSLEEVGGQAALYVNDPIGITETTIRLINEPGFRNKTVNGARKQADKFSWQKSTSMFIKLIDELGAQA